MSGSTAWLWRKNPGLVPRMAIARMPVLVPERCRPSANTPPRAARADTTEGSEAVAADTCPAGRLARAMLQKKSGGLLRYGWSRTRTGSRNPLLRLSSASSAMRASSWFHRLRAPSGKPYTMAAAIRGPMSNTRCRLSTLILRRTVLRQSRGNVAQVLVSSPDSDRNTQARRRPARRGPSLFVQALLVTVIIIASLGGCLFWDPTLAALIVAEDAPVEMVEVVLLAMALALCLVRWRGLLAAGRSPASEVVLAVGFFILLEGEIELWQRVLGSTMTFRHTFRQPPALFAVWLSLYAVMLALLVLIASYVLRRLVPLWRWGLAALRTDWGRLLVLSVAILVLTEVFERRLNRILPTVFPKSLLEETLELIAGAYAVLALIERERVEPVKPAPPAEA